MASRDKVVLISLRTQPWFDEMYTNLLAAMRRKVSIERAEDEATALRLLSQEPAPAAVLVTDEEIVSARTTWVAVIGYVRHGGTAVVMGHFPSFVNVTEIPSFFALAGLKWQCASYQRSESLLNSDAVGTELAKKLPSSYSQKAVSLRDFEPADAWYLLEDGDQESAALLASVGRGKLGFLGDVNNEKESETVLLAMCGLL
ncbi:hypothetical protein CP533_5160 [Ophiocordyceps camponoti-saundersi (nom. inval.)]|nr:hypothetical protein CP533_5160 [Ophiocordyceps camponoti-saundersi (nom. inval.)]